MTRIGGPGVGHLRRTPPLPALLCLVLAAPACAADFDCRPSGKAVCLDGTCRSEAAGSFEHAESFAYDARAGRLSACLWSDCYDGDALRLREAGPLVVTGRLYGREGRDVVLSLAIDGDGRFTAAWDLSGRGATLDTGTCSAGDSRP